MADTAFRPPLPQPAFETGKGPRVLIDEAHHNFHTADGRYLPFANLLRRDGYAVRGGRAEFSRETLAGIDILVISNALAARNVEDWSLPNPSAFSDAEIAAVRAWVADGGALLLIADHMPMAGAAEKLGAAFGIRWSNGFALDEKRPGPLVFQRDSGLASHPITEGRNPGERVDTVATFTGSAFQGDADTRPLLTFQGPVVSLMPSTAWEFKPETPRVPVAGWLQGAVLRCGRGRVAVFGEAAMFTAQLAGPEKKPTGMNAPAAPQNARFLLNVMHWLSGLLD
ncbi:MAG: DUF4350 domain-containing protein [Acidobacteria bacterium]|nr:DUF4350 domain-containing protein [Acidobacteriota bacterium]